MMVPLERPAGKPAAFLSFTKSKGPVEKGLKEGQCAFDDRAVAPEEPSLLCFNPKPGILSFGSTGVNKTLAFATNNGDPAANLLVEVLEGNSKLVSFTVSNSPADHCFTITSFGP